MRIHAASRLAAAVARGRTVDADYFDGLHAQPHRVRLVLDRSAGTLHVVGDGIERHVALPDVQWPERSRHGARIAHLHGGGTLYAHDGIAWDAWVRAAGLGESPVVKAQQSWRGALLAMVLLIAVAAGGYAWGVPLLARAVLAALPASVDRAIGDVALASLDRHLLLPSRLPAARQQQLRDAFARAVERFEPPGRRTAWELRFRTSAADTDDAGDKDSAAGRNAAPRTRLGPNAFALPGGVIVVTDDMVALLDGRDDVLLGVLGHELGHLRQRHGMRTLVQGALIGSAASLAWGDFSAVLAAAPALLGQQAYSRDFERAADADAIGLLRADGVAPTVMTELFTRLDAYRAARRVHDDAFDLGIAFASHPADAERVRAFRDADPP